MGANGRVLFSAWPLAAAACFAAWAPDAATEPVVTAVLTLFGLAALIAVSGPAGSRRASLAFATVGLGYLALVYGPGGAAQARWSPSGPLFDRLARAWFPLATNTFGINYESAASHNFRFLGGLITAWLLAAVSCRLVWTFGTARSMPPAAPD
jgi:hypothetical protein